MNDSLPDIQHTQVSEIPFYINQVGVSNVKVPFKLLSTNGGIYNLVGTVEMVTDLKDDIKGISMGMLLRTLLNYLDQPFKHDILEKVLQEFKVAVETDSKNSLIKFEFELPLYKTAPISGITFPQYYECAFIGKMNNNKFRFFQKFRIYYGSYCPCSASLCDDLEQKGSTGFPHAQRSYCDILVEIKPENYIFIETIIELIEDVLKTSTCPILRRSDEQEYARIAAENLMFVEDAIRRISNCLNKEPLIYDWIVKCVHMESIHTSNAIATCWKGVNFDASYYF
jgi:GTP cyclohydrolase I